MWKNLCGLVSVTQRLPFFLSVWPKPDLTFVCFNSQVHQTDFYLLDSTIVAERISLCFLQSDAEDDPIFWVGMVSSSLQVSTFFFSWKNSSVLVWSELRYPLYPFQGHGVAGPIKKKKNNRFLDYGRKLECLLKGHACAGRTCNRMKIFA